MPTEAAPEAPTRDDLIRNLLDMAQKRVEAAKAGPEKRVLHPETWTIPHTHYNDVRTNDCGHEIHYGWLEIGQEIENVQQLMDHLGIPDGLPQGKGDADWRVAEAVLRLGHAQARLGRIAENHSREEGPMGMVGDYCTECGWRWPCPTYRFANGDGDALDPWRDDD